MYTPFNQMPESSKIWIYQSDRVFSASEKDYIAEQLKIFTEEWTAHNNLLKTSFDIRYNFFIILSVDEKINDVSGCSIDKSVNVIKNIGTQLNINFFERLNVAYLADEKTVKISNINNLKSKIVQGEINTDSFIFNNLVSNISELNQKWIIKAENSWLKKYFITA